MGLSVMCFPIFVVVLVVFTFWGGDTSKPPQHLWLLQRDWLRRCDRHGVQWLYAPCEASSGDSTEGAATWWNGLRWRPHVEPRPRIANDARGIPPLVFLSVAPS